MPQDEADKLVVVERGDLVFVFNFHPTNSYTDYGIGTYLPGPYKVLECCYHSGSLFSSPLLPGKHR